MYVKFEITDTMKLFNLLLSSLVDMTNDRNNLKCRSEFSRSFEVFGRVQFELYLVIPTIDQW